MESGVPPVRTRLHRRRRRRIRRTNSDPAVSSVGGPRDSSPRSGVCPVALRAGSHRGCIFALLAASRSSPDVDSRCVRRPLALRARARATVPTTVAHRPSRGVARGDTVPVFHPQFTGVTLHVRQRIHVDARLCFWTAILPYELGKANAKIQGGSNGSILPPALLGTFTCSILFLTLVQTDQLSLYRSFDTGMHLRDAILFGPFVYLAVRGAVIVLQRGTELERFEWFRSS